MQKITAYEGTITEIVRDRRYYVDVKVALENSPFGHVDYRIDTMDIEPELRPLLGLQAGDKVCLVFDETAWPDPNDPGWYRPPMIAVLPEIRRIRSLRK